MPPRGACWWMAATRRTARFISAVIPSTRISVKPGIRGTTMKREAAVSILALVTGGGLLAPRPLHAAAPCSVASVDYEGSGTNVLTFRGSPGKQTLRIDF